MSSYHGLAWAVLRAVGEAIVVTDRAARVLLLNPAAERLLRVAAGEAEGVALGELLATDGPGDGWPALLAEALSSPDEAAAPRSVRCHCRRRDGSGLRVLVTVAPLPAEAEGWPALPAGSPAAVVTVQAVTAEHEARYGRRSDRDFGLQDLVSGVAHELNAPLGAILGYAQMLQGGPVAPDVLQRRAAAIVQQAEAARRTVRRLLSLGRPRREGLGPVSLNDVIERAVGLAEYALQAADTTVSLQLQPGLPPVLGDADDLGHVSLNLIANAHQALAGQPPPRKLTITTWAAGHEVRASFADTGPGVPAEGLERIFEPYFTTKESAHGTGLGLALCREIVEEGHGGRLWAEAAEPHGLVVHVALPVLAATGADVVRRPVEDQAATPAGTPSELRVLVVEDEPAMTELLRSYLEESGHEVTVAATMSEALGHLEAGQPAGSPFDAVVSDLRLAQGTGEGLHAALAEIQPGLAERVVFITGDLETASARRFLRDLGNPVLQKPFGLHELARALAAVVGDRSG